MHLGAIPSATITAIPSGVAGTRAVLQAMKRLTIAGRIGQRVRQTALQIVRNLPQKAVRSEILRLHRFVRDNIRYVKDVHGVETLQTPERTLINGQGDCDDKSILLSAMLESIGTPTRFVAMSFAPFKNYSHVMIEARLGTRWIPLETTEPVAAGWRPPRKHKRMVVHVR